LIHVHCCVKREDWEVLDREDYPEDFLWKALLRYADIATKGRTGRHRELKLCDYHTHATDEEQYACKKEQRQRKRMRF
jgi:hypothetical protein